MQISATMSDALRAVPLGKPVLIAGPTASGKSALALEIAARQGGIIVNADALQVYDCWRIITARPSLEEEAQAPHHLYGHVSADADYSAGHWLREVAQILTRGERAIIVGGTGLYFSALTQGLADIPPVPAAVREKGNALSHEALQAGLDPRTLGRIDLLNRARVQRAWEVQEATGRGLADWQDQTPKPVLGLDACHAIAFDVDKGWLNTRIAKRFDLMIEGGALEEVAAIAPAYDPAKPAHRAIGVPELLAHLDGHTDLQTAKEKAIIATRQYAKRQRTWLRKGMRDWQKVQLG